MNTCAQFRVGVQRIDKISRPANAHQVHDQIKGYGRGPRGSGKSSVLEYVTSVDADAIARIWSAVNHESEETLRDPTQSARHLIRRIVRWARDSEAMTAEERHAHLLQTAATLPTSTRSRKTDLSLSLALHWLQPGIGREVAETVRGRRKRFARG